ncbi:MotA/TolQ/ExbB proton channel family protein [bacterium]|nr:MotA/TolQ/ExbB proton channel family protein [bacterium]
MGNILISSWQQSDWAGKIDIIVLGFLSIYSWYVIFSKYFSLKEIEKKNRIVGNLIISGKKIISLRCPLFNLIRKGEKIIERKGKIDEKEMEKLFIKETNKLKIGLSALATIASVAPFLGLLGTVWGLLRSFNSISITGSASVRVVSSGVAEALITTVIGLIVAIPAAVGYNYYQEKTERIKDDIFSLSGDILNYLKAKNE